MEELAQYYSLEGIDTQPHILGKNLKSLADLKIVGTIKGMKGPMLITGIGTTLQSLDLKMLIGYRIDDVTPVEVVTQSGILDFV